MNPSEAIIWILLLYFAATIYCVTHREWTKRVLRELERGYARQVYTELYMAGAITLQEYLEMMEEV